MKGVTDVQKLHLWHKQVSKSVKNPINFRNIQVTGVTRLQGAGLQDDGLPVGKSGRGSDGARMFATFQSPHSPRGRGHQAAKEIPPGCAHRGLRSGPGHQDCVPREGASQPGLSEAEGARRHTKLQFKKEKQG